ncbi:MAG: glycosyltransferase family 4 protein [Rubricoccaceae bacterium]
MTASPIRRVCVLWADLRPYHIARLDALHRRLISEGVEGLALEVTATSERTESFSFRHEALWTDAHYDTLPADALRQRVHHALDRHQPDAVAITSYSTPDARAALAWCRRHRKTAVMLFDSRREDAERSLWREAIKRALVTQFDAALVAGTPQREYAVELGIPGNAIFTPFDVVDNVHYAQPSLGVSPEQRRGFLVAARLAPVKNLDGLLEAYAQYREATNDPWPLSIVGDGPDRAALEQAAPPGVAFAGHVGLDDMPSWYRQAGAFVLPSHKDTWGLVVNEAMASGLPVLVSTGAGCARDLVDEGVNGYRFSPDDPDELAKHLETLATSSPQARDQMGAASREIIAQYSPEAFADGLWKAIQMGTQRADRGLSLQASIVLFLLRRLARTTRSFQSIPD